MILIPDLEACSKSSIFDCVALFFVQVALGVWDNIDILMVRIKTKTKAGCRAF